jgi:hypothetical protein
VLAAKAVTTKSVIAASQMRKALFSCDIPPPARHILPLQGGESIVGWLAWLMRKAALVRSELQCEVPQVALLNRFLEIGPFKERIALPAS